MRPRVRWERPWMYPRAAQCGSESEIGMSLTGRGLKNALLERNEIASLAKLRLARDDNEMLEIPSRLSAFLLVAGLLLAACAPRAVTFPISTKYVQPSSQLPLVLPSPTAESNQPTPTEVLTETPAP